MGLYPKLKSPPIARRLIGAFIEFYLATSYIILGVTITGPCMIFNVAIKERHIGCSM
jgi:hypothetical protein